MSENSLGIRDFAIVGYKQWHQDSPTECVWVTVYRMGNANREQVFSES
jgi:hypothetical protein